MSCVAINYEEYAKCAGIVSVLTIERSSSHYKGEDNNKLIELFKELYRMNIKSYNYRYNKALKDEIDPIVFMLDWRGARARAKKMVRSHKKHLYLVAKVNEFLSSVLYQMDDDECHTKTKQELYYILREMIAYSPIPSEIENMGEMNETWWWECKGF